VEDKKVIEVRKLSLRRGEQSVLCDVSISVDKAEIVCLLGPSGGGKSSLLRCVNRLLEPTPSTVFIDGQDVTAIDVITLRRRVGMLLQTAYLFPGTVSDNVGYGPHLRNEILPGTRVAELLTMAGLDASFGSHPADRLSGGEGQRVAIARALATEPEILLLDEPTSALDPAATHHVEETILSLRERLALTVLWVSHDTAQTRRVADRVYLLVDGTVADEGTPEHLFREGSKHLSLAFAQGRLSNDGQVDPPIAGQPIDAGRVHDAT
jgi:ABC-type sulfate/molybdate transport systems ATPase subunit